MLAATTPFPQYFDIGGDPLDSGYLYLGLVDQDPITHPITVFWDAEGTLPAAQPIRTVNGLPARSGTPALIFTNSNYSLTVKNKAGRQVFYATDSGQFSNSQLLADNLTASNALLAATGGAQLVGWIQSGTGARLRTLQDKVRETRVSVCDFGAVGDWNGTTGTDNTAAFQAAINYVQSTNNPALYASNSPGAGSSELLVPAGSYMISRNLTVNRKLTIVGEGSSEFSTGSRITQTGSNTDTFTLVPQTAGMSFGLTNLVLKANQSGNGHHVNVTVTAGPGCNSQRYTGCTFSNPQSQSLNLIGDDILISDCLFDVSQYSGNSIALGTLANAATNVTISNCNFFNSPTRVVLVYNVDGLLMIGNKVTQPVSVGKTDYFIDASNATPTKVRNVTIIGTVALGLRTLFTGYNAKNIVICGNNLNACGYGSGESFPGLMVLSGACDGFLVSGNLFSGGYDTHNFYNDQAASAVINANITDNIFINTFGAGACLAALNTTGRLFPNTFTGWNPPAAPAVYCRDFMAAGAVLDGGMNLVYGPIIATEATLGQSFVITPTDALSFILAIPTNPSWGQLIEYTIRNTTGGALGAVTFNAAFKLIGAWVQPAPGKSRAIAFRWDGSGWIEKYRSTADVSN